MNRSEGLMGSYIGTVFLSTSVYDQEKRKKKKQKANFCLDSNVIFACATFIFIFSLTRNVNFPGKLDFSKRTANTNNFFKGVIFLEAVILSFGVNGGLGKKKRLGSIHFLY